MFASYTHSNDRLWRSQMMQYCKLQYLQHDSELVKLSRMVLSNSYHFQFRIFLAWDDLVNCLCIYLFCLHANKMKLLRYFQKLMLIFGIVTNQFKFYKMLTSTIMVQWLIVKMIVWRICYYQTLSLVITWHQPHLPMGHKYLHFFMYLLSSHEEPP